MVAMLIVKAVLLLGVARCASTSENSIIKTRSKRDLTTLDGPIIWSRQSNNSQGNQYVIPYSSTSASPRDPLQAGTTVHTQHNPSSGVTYSPYQYRENVNAPSARDVTSHRAKIGQPTLQGGFKVSNVQTLANRVSPNGYKSNSASHGPRAGNQPQSRPPIGGTENSQYYGNPSNYRLIAESTKVPAQLISSGSFPVSAGDFPPFPKFKSSPSALSGSIYTDHTFENLPKYRFSPSAPYNVRSAPLVGSSRVTNAPIYGSSTYPVSKNINTGPSSFANEFSSPSSVKSFDKLGNDYHQFDGGSSADYKNSPVLGSPKSGPEITGLVRAFESEPVILSAGLDHQTRPSSSGPNFHYTQARNPYSPNDPSSFPSNVGNYQPKFLPIHSSKSTPQIPHYKAASTVNEFSNNKPVDAYEHLGNQPQLHFTAETTTNSAKNRQPIVYHSKPFERIRTDVELINKKRTTTPSPYDSDEHDYDQDFKTAGRDFGYSADDESDDSSPLLKDQARNGNYELPRSNLFNSYDEAFGKYSKLASIDHQDITEKRAPPIVHETSKPVYQSIEEDDDDKSGDKSSSSSGEYHSSYTEDKEPNASYEHEDEGESRKSERQGFYDEKEEIDDDDDGDKSPYKSYGEDFEREFEDSYRKELPKSDYVHVKEVPEIEESRSESKKYLTNHPSTKTTRGGLKEKTRHVVRGAYEKPKKYETQTSHEYENQKNNYKDNEGHGSRASYKRTKITEPQSEESYGHKIPRDRGTARFARNEDLGTNLKDGESSKETSNDREPQGRTSKSSSMQKPLTTTTISSFETVQSYTLAPFTSWKPGKKLIRDRDSYGAAIQDVRAFFNPETSNYPLPQVYREGLKYLSNGQVIRDLTGI